MPPKKRTGPQQQVEPEEQPPTREELEAAGVRGVPEELVRFGVVIIPRLRALGKERLHRALLCCSEYSLQEPLQYHHKQDLRVPLFSEKRRFSGGEIIALMTFGIWVWLGESEEAFAPLADSSPEVLAAARVLAARADRREREARELKELEEKAPLFAAAMREAA
jgi:hypothetical protein